MSAEESPSWWKCPACPALIAGMTPEFLEDEVEMHEFAWHHIAPAR